MESDTSVEHEENNVPFDLDSYFPYIIRVASTAVGDAASNMYLQLSNFTAPQWRTIVVLGPNNIMSASDIVNLSRMDKVTVSRAIIALKNMGFVSRNIDGEDRRRAVVHLTHSGREIYKNFIPKAKMLEDELFAGLSTDEKEMVIELLKKVGANARRFTSS